MSFFKKLKSGLQTDKNQTQINKSVSLGSLSLKSASSSGDPSSCRPATPPLGDFIKNLENLGTNDLEARGLASSRQLEQRRSRLSKTTREVLNDPPALAYFIQYLEVRDAVTLVKFWLDVEGFKSSASKSSLSNVPPGGCQNTHNQVEVPSVSNSESSHSIDSGIGRNDSEVEAAEEVTSPRPEAAGHDAAQLARTRTEDAVAIYRRYIAPDCPGPGLRVPTEYKKEIVEQICAESGEVGVDCFTSAQEKVVRILEAEFFPDFLKSEFHAKHLVDVLTGGSVLIADILYNDTALAHFMEFMDQSKQTALMEFWLTASNFQLSHKSESSQEDAMVLYEKYFSMQASTPIGFNDAVRLHIENNICSEGGPDNSCFDMPLEIILQYLERNYLQKFLISPMFKNYIKELIGTITASPRSLSSVAGAGAGSGAWRDSDERSDCSSEHSSNNNNRGNSTNNTLLAMSSAPTSPDGKQHHNNNNSFSELDNSGSDLPDADLLWRRTPMRNEIGRINSLGRYEPGWDVAPDTSRAQGTKPSSRISKAVKKLVTNEDHDKMKEEMAWQVAEMFVKEVTSVTLSPGPGPGPAITQSASADYSLADISLDLDNLELPAAKYF